MTNESVNGIYKIYYLQVERKMLKIMNETWRTNEMMNKMKKMICVVTAGIYGKCTGCGRKQAK